MIDVMVIDDEPFITSMIENALSGNPDIRVSAYNNPLQAIAALSSKQPDVVLLDIMMPQMDGIKALEEIKEKCPSTKVIMITAYSTLDRVLSSHKKGAHDFVIKPFDSLTLIEEKCLKAAGSKSSL